jgi:hypothetical protein
VDELPPVERRALIDALTGRVGRESSRESLAGLASTPLG